MSECRSESEVLVPLFENIMVDRKIFVFSMHLNISFYGDNFATSLRAFELLFSFFVILSSVSWSITGSTLSAMTELLMHS
jgi:hypothetical protein